MAYDNALNPESGLWYKRRDDGNSFEVLFVDADEGDIEIRYFDGAIEMLDLHSWYRLRLIRREPPHCLYEGDTPVLERSEFNSAAQVRWSGPLDWGGRRLAATSSVARQACTAL